MRIYWFFIWRNLNPLHPKMLCAKIDWNWPSSSAWRRFLNFVNVFSLFRNYLPRDSGEGHVNTNGLPADGRRVGRTDGRTVRRTDGQTDDGRQVIRKAHLSFQLRWAKKGVTPRKKMESQFPVDMRIYTLCPSYLQSFRKFCWAVSEELR